MGCSESKDKNTINVKAAKEKLFESTGKIISSSPSSASSGMGSSASTTSEKGSKPSSTSSSFNKKSAKVSDLELEDEYLQNSENQDEIPTTLEAIPTNDLGESLDAKKMRTLWSGSGFGPPNIEPLSSSELVSSSRQQRTNMSASSSAKSIESSDSGVYELDDIITENSSAELVARVENDFTPVENIDLTITGKACPRLLSGSQRVRQQEQEIMDSLREEGFIATSKQKTTGGLAFEVTEASPVAQSAGGKIKPMNFLPKKHKEILEKHIHKFHLKDLTPEDVSRRQFLAEERRRLEMEAKLEKLSSLSHKANINDKVEELKKKKDTKEESALEKREAHLKELRDKLKAQNQRARQIKLKKTINGPPVPVPVKASFKSRSVRASNDDDDFY